MMYFTHLLTIVNTMLSLHVSVPDELQSLIVEERERFRFTPEDYANAARLLGFGRDNDLGVELDSDVDDDFIAQAWRSARQRAWLDASDAARKRAQLNDALKIVAEQRGSEALLKVWSDEKGSGMSPETAYQTLDVPRDVDETMLLTVYSMRVRGGLPLSSVCLGLSGVDGIVGAQVEDQPSQSERMREALSVIAEVTGSERLRQFLATGNDREFVFLPDSLKSSHRNPFQLAIQPSSIRVRRCQEASISLGTRVISTPCSNTSIRLRICAQPSHPWPPQTRSHSMTASSQTMI